jgi:signal transduction histidine kinase
VKNSADNAQDTATEDLLLADSPEEDDDPILEDEDPAPARQGLPAGFRMRHDRHYVDELMGVRVPPASRAVPHVTEPPASSPKEKTDDADRALHTALAAVSERLDAIRQHARAGRTRNAVSSFDRALEVELDRASALAHAALMIAGDVTLTRRDVKAGDIADRAMRAIAPLRRFGGIRFDASVDDAAYRIAIDPVAATHAVAGALYAFADLVDASRDAEDDAPVVHVRVKGVQPRPALMIEIAAAGVSLTEDTLSAFFEPAAACHPAGAEGALLLSAAARIARAHGGRADVERGGGGEIVVLLVFPKAH